MLYDKKWDQKLPRRDDVGQVLLDAADMIEERGWMLDDKDGQTKEKVVAALRAAAYAV